MIYGSVCSGIEAASVAWGSLGWEPAWFSEILPFPNAVLAYRYPTTPNLGDMRNIYDKETFQKSGIDLLVGGTPCQSFSFACESDRGGLADPRGNLALEYVRVAAIKQPRWLVWENVPGVLSSGQGRDFGTFLGKLVELGYGCAGRVLDARHFGVPQRRRRVYLVAYLGDWRCAAAVLFEPGLLRRDTAADQDEGRKSSAVVRGSTGKKVRLPIGVDVYNYKVTGDIAATLGANCFVKNAHGPKVLDSRGFRIHTPLECERLMGFPDGYTDVSFKSRNPDKHRMAALGNSMVVPVMRWIGKRITAVEAIA